MALKLAISAASLLIGCAHGEEQGLPDPDATDAVGVVETKAVTGTGVAKGMTTYRLALKLGHDAGNVYTIFGDEGRPMSFPPAFNVASPFGTNVGGVNPAFFPLGKGSEFDSWLTVGMVNGESTSALSAIGLDLKSWSTTQGVSTTNGAVFWMQPQDGPSVTDCDGAKGNSKSPGDVVVAQLTVPTGKAYSAIVNCQGHTKSFTQGKPGSGKENYESVKISYSFGSGGDGGGGH